MGIRFFGGSGSKKSGLKIEIITAIGFETPNIQFFFVKETSSILVFYNRDHPTGSELESDLDPDSEPCKRN